MKKLIILILIITGCAQQNVEVRKNLSLAGEWKFRIDSLDVGIKNKWYNELASETVKLPGSMAENGKGDEVTLKTPWTGDIVDKSYFTEKKYERYRQAGNIKIPFWLKPVKYYKGVAWYQKEVEIPKEFDGKRVILFLERCHWESTLFVNDKNAGSANSLATQHEFDITGYLVPGKNRISVRIDNRIVIPVGVNSHSISDHTQSNWNGIVGNISLTASSKVFIRDIKVYPDVIGKKAKIIVALTNKPGTLFKGKLMLQAESFNSATSQKIKSKVVQVSISSYDTQIIIDYPMGKNIQLWSEFNPSLYNLNIILKDADGDIIDSKAEEFGMRDFKANGTRFEVNGQQIFLRGTTECAIFPLTGYPPTDVPSWERVLQTCKDYGLNHVRFHSYCPPEAAFIAADKLGVYFHIECSSWPTREHLSVTEGLSMTIFIRKVTGSLMNTETTLHSV
jgi:beta-galactosidase/beta-glucuronidase